MFQGLHILCRAAANDASHDSAERYPQPRCHPETRTEIIEGLHSWSSEDDNRSAVLWLCGPAGAGKSAISQSLCQRLEAEGRLGGTFFFKRGHPSRGHAMKLFPTIAYQLALLFPEFKVAVVERVEADPSILIIEPARQSFPRRMVAIVIIDGLDECEGQDFQREILRSIGNAVRKSQLPLRFLVASRPEPHIQEVFRGPSLAKRHRHLNIQQSFDDVRRYLRDEFARIHREHHETMATVASPWPSPADIDTIIRKLSGYFIYAATVIKFIDDKNFRPTEQLELYTQILAAVPVRPQLLKILTVLALKWNLSVLHIEQLLELKPGDVRLLLRGLHSVICIPSVLSESPDDLAHSQSDNHSVRVHHASFLDFLKDPTRSNVFHVGDVHRTGLASNILKVLS
ncbi:hypothetical protein DFH09DRAFT_1246855 [Mycena vulgaris]|nr:hypothetical protein DFH09DRAFT_1246855 [Mycena vulgaris]